MLTYQLAESKVSTSPNNHLSMKVSKVAKEKLTKLSASYDEQSPVGKLIRAAADNPSADSVGKLLDLFEGGSEPHEVVTELFALLSGFTPDKAPKVDIEL